VSIQKIVGQLKKMFLTNDRIVNVVTRFIALIATATLLASCGGRDTQYGVQTGKPDRRTLGLASSHNKSVFDRGAIGYSSFDDMPMPGYLTELEKRFEIHRLTDVEASKVHDDFQKMYRAASPWWWPKQSKFLASLFMDGLVVYLADDPSRQGFVMIRIQQGSISVIPAMPTARDASPHKEDVARRASLISAMKKAGLKTSENAFEWASLNVEDGQVKHWLYSQTQCGKKYGNPTTLGALTLVTTDGEAQSIKAVTPLPVPESVVPCFEDTPEGRQHVVGRSVSLQSQMTTTQGSLISLNINHRLGADDMSWPGDSLHSKHLWLYWCAKNVDCELITQYSPSFRGNGFWPSRGVITSFAVGLNKAGRAVLQQWEIDQGEGNLSREALCERLVVKDSWQLEEKATRLKSAGARIEKAPLDRTFVKATKAYEYRIPEDPRRDAPRVFLGLHPDCPL
jgi:hypothetical protein